MTFGLLCFPLLFVLSITSAQVDPSLGTYSCYPCGRAMCGFAGGGSPNTIIDTSAVTDSTFDRAPSRSCREIQYLADTRALDPEVCSIYSQITLSSEDPCDCRRRTRPFSDSSTDEKCTDPNQQQQCPLCGNNNKIIGDPEKHLPSESGFPTSCIAIFDLQNEIMAEGQGGFSGAMCNRFQPFFAQHCKCVLPGTPVTQCIEQESTVKECDPTKSDDQCCVGHCRYVHTYRRNFCTFKEEEPAPSMISSPMSDPTNFPTREPTRIPTRPPTRPPTNIPFSSAPSLRPTRPPTLPPTRPPTNLPTRPPTRIPTQPPTYLPTRIPTLNPTPETEIPKAPPFGFPMVFNFTRAPTRPPTDFPLVFDISRAPSETPIILPPSLAGFSGFGNFFGTAPGNDECDPESGCEDGSLSCKYLDGLYNSYKCVPYHVEDEKVGSIFPKGSKPNREPERDTPIQPEGTD